MVPVMVAVGSDGNNNCFEENFKPDPVPKEGKLLRKSWFDQSSGFLFLLPRCSVLAKRSQKPTLATACASRRVPLCHRARASVHAWRMAVAFLALPCSVKMWRLLTAKMRTGPLSAFSSAQVPATVGAASSTQVGTTLQSHARLPVMTRPPHHPGVRSFASRGAICSPALLRSPRKCSAPAAKSQKRVSLMRRARSLHKPAFGQLPKPARRWPLCWFRSRGSQRSGFQL